ncbi:hypothetical protein M441DRAFT_59825 [Trichoderma asperellum CBS 433.97]|uniref:Uncharacterized protein n=1 Tax=Trichoderma asperellum (strain ATCC 204424 / CBS 433.97 / NBRC 101777) TaxID=1042311 RepID=A0A2T3Z159_TRIA4|nr:hypothetical protein M441DRAFT_59825 [Trichoderma asperellum CBS 433.97]PTB38554.1 hypothetical protein M441DRAFT_59825 [Trichoderma asperellum CBS 433.97]
MAIDNMERHGQRSDDYPSGHGRLVQAENTADFFNSIALGQEGVVRDFIEQDSEISNTPNEHGETPLIAAVRADKPVIVRDLLWNGAKVDALGCYCQEGQNTRAWRTPLQVAAAEGKLHMIRILRENRADVFFAAPGGVNALQLATSNGHESVVDHIQRAYVSIRGHLVTPDGVTSDGLTDAAEIYPTDSQRSAEGGQAQHTRLLNEKRFGCITWGIPKTILHKASKTIVSTLSNVLEDRPKKTQLCRKNVELWCQENFQVLPACVKRGIDLVDRGVKEAAGLVTKTPERTWQLMKRIPNAMWTIMLYIGMVLRKLGKIAPRLLKQMTAIVQTIAKAVANIFQAARLRGIKNCFSSMLETVLTEVTKSLSWLVTGLKQTTRAILQAVTGSLKKVVIIFAALTLGICILFSNRTWGLLQASGKQAKKGIQDILESMGPKTM